MPLALKGDTWPRRRQPSRLTRARIEKAIKQGKKVVIFPSRITEKDLNDMVLKGIDVNSMLESNTYQSLTATIKYNEWKRL